MTQLGPVRRTLFPGLAGRGNDGSVALTFDDGPDPASTPHFLDVLDRLGVKATFFLLGSMAARSRSLVAEIHAAGHDVAVHGWDHRMTLLQTPGQVRDNINRAADLVADITHAAPLYYRPPYGVLSTPALVAAHQLGLRTVLWTSWGKDWRADATPESVLAFVRSQLGPGGTVLLHDSDCTSAPGAWRSALGAVEPLVDHVRAHGWTPVPLSAHGLT